LAPEPDQHGDLDEVRRVAPADVEGADEDPQRRREADQQREARTMSSVCSRTSQVFCDQHDDQQQCELEQELHDGEADGGQRQDEAREADLLDEVRRPPTPLPEAPRSLPG